MSKCLLSYSMIDCIKLIRQTFHKSSIETLYRISFIVSMDSDDEWFSTNSYERDDESSINIKISLATPTFIKPALI